VIVANVAYLDYIM